MCVQGRYHSFNMAPLSAKIRPGINAECECLQGRSCQKCSTAGSETRVGADLANMLLETLSKLNKLTKEVSFLQKCLHVQSVKQQRLEVTGSVPRGAGVAFSSVQSNNEGSECEGRNSAYKSSSRFIQARNRSNKAN